MPNWVFNNLWIEGRSDSISSLIEQMNSPFVTEYKSSSLTGEANVKDYPNPVFAFWNICRPSDLEAYYGEEVFKKENRSSFNDDGSFNNEKFMTEFTRSMAEDNDWYHWNVRNWGTKWDVAVSPDEAFPNTLMEDYEVSGDFASVMYRFETAWSPPIEALQELSRQYPDVCFTYRYEEETGWGGTGGFNAGHYEETEYWDIPSCHADFVAQDRGDCRCSDYPNEPQFWYEDCPREEA